MKNHTTLENLISRATHNQTGTASHGKWTVEVNRTEYKAPDKVCNLFVFRHEGKFTMKLKQYAVSNGLAPSQGGNDKPLTTPELIAHNVQTETTLAAMNSILWYFGIDDRLDLKQYSVRLQQDVCEDMRHCNRCKDPMFEGYVYEESGDYWCSDACLSLDFTPEEAEDHYNEEGGGLYWTDWHDDFVYKCGDCLHVHEDYTALCDLCEGVNIKTISRDSLSAVEASQREVNES